MSPSLTSLRKDDLVKIAQEWGLSTSGLKSEIEARITEEIKATGKTLEKYFGKSSAPATPSPAKRRSTSAAAVKKTTTTSSEGKTEEETETFLQKKLFTPSKKLYESSLGFVSKGKDLLPKKTLSFKIPSIKVDIISVWSLIIAALLFEIHLIVESFIPFDYTKPKAWCPVIQPFIPWLVFSFGLPLAIASLFNYSALKKKSGKLSQVAGAGAKADPLIFLLSKTVIAYVVYYGYINRSLAGKCKCSEVVFKNIPKVNAALGDTPFITGITLIVVILYVS